MSSKELQRARARLGTTLRGKYRLDAVLGVGGMAVVYKATHRNRAEFAVKMLLPEYSNDDEMRKRFLREGYAANSVKHSGVVAVVDDDVAEDGAAFLVMELLSGMSVEDLWIRYGGRLPAHIAICIATQLLDVLASAHAAGIVHRDLKPANLFVTREGVVKVLDFGIARVRDLIATGPGLTQSGMAFGTPAFMAPEQAMAKAREVDERSDLWSVGATMFTLMSGRLVHDAENGPQIMIKVATIPAPPLGSVAPDVPPEVAAAVDRALAYEKSNRWQSAAEMRDYLIEVHRAYCGAAPAAATLATFAANAPPPVKSIQEARTLPADATPWTEAAVATDKGVSSDKTLPKVGRRRGTLVAAAIAVLGLVAGGVVLVATRSSRPDEKAPPKVSSPASPPQNSSTESVVELPAASLSNAPSASVVPSASASVVHPPITKPAVKMPAKFPPKPDCDPPFTLDGDGHKSWKLGCFHDK